MRLAMWFAATTIFDHVSASVSIPAHVRSFTSIMTTAASASTTSTVVHVHDHDHVHDYVSRRCNTLFQPGNFTAARHLWPLHHGHHRPAVKFPGYYV
jgi:hypothetical protein